MDAHEDDTAVADGGAIGIRRLSMDAARDHFAGLVALLQDAVHDGASIGFLRPLAATEAERYWESVLGEVAGGTRILLGALDDGEMVGSVQLALCTKQNGLHRAEVQKLLVHTGARRQGLGRALMARLEHEARVERLTLLHLDTEPHQPAERMYAALGWTRAGEIPAYATTPDGRMHSTVVFYKLLSLPEP